MLTVMQARMRVRDRTNKARPTNFVFIGPSSLFFHFRFFRLSDSFEPAHHLFKADLFLRHPVDDIYTKKGRFLHQVFDALFMDRPVEREGVVLQGAQDADFLESEAADEPHPELARTHRSLLP